MRPPRAVMLDVGGVLTLPHPTVVGEALDAAGIAYDPVRLEVAHYHGVAALDAASGATWTDRAPEPYVEGWVDAIEVPDARRAAARAAIHELLARPSLPVWSAVTPWARPGLSALADSGLDLAIVSNSDGSVTHALQEHRLCQVGRGPGVEVAAIVDSAEIGVAKPDPAIFEPALEAVDAPPEACWYVGDTVTFDVVGAEAAGLVPLHLDPLDHCVDPGHRHVADLVEVVALFDHDAPAP